ncbi:MAG TPA: mannosyltransferase family protein [Solirubrobacteraceae bacterium]|nr:mannosyltransferase family protein [Solirubrobacteraceae bacterium]
MQVEPPEIAARATVSPRWSARRSRLGLAWARLDASQRAAATAAARALVGSRVLVWVAGTVAFLAWGVAVHAHSFDPAGLTRGLGAVGDALAAPAARWDASWYLSIAHGGYGAHLVGAGDGGVAFFPLYPLLLWALGSLGANLVAAGIVVSMVALLVALYLTHRLAELEFGAGDAARLAVMATALFPMAFFFSAVYSEALYLALSLGVFWMARHGRWAAVGALGGLAAATRSTGVLLMIPALVLYLYGPREDATAASARARWRPRYQLRRDVLWLALIPAGLGAYLGYLGLQGADPLAPFAAQQVWFRHFAGPFGGVWDGAVAAWQGARQLLSGSRAHVYFTGAGGDPFIAAEHNIVLFGFLAAAIPALVGVARRLPVAYGAYVLAALALPLSYPVTPQPLMSLPRFLAALFPLHLWTGSWLARHPRARLPVLSLYAAGLVVFTAQFATWHWVA